MNINRDNYEFFFLLYVDNELSAAERDAVNEFVIQNPDLQKELLILEESILRPGSIIFEDKESLLREEFIVTDMQEKLLLYIDNELPENESTSLQGLMAADTSLKKEWGLLQQTKLSADSTIVFDDKRSLYRTETRRVTPFPWWRIAAAAILLGFGIWGGLKYFKTPGRIEENGTVTHNQDQPLHTIIKTDQVKEKQETKENTVIAPGNSAAIRETIKQPPSIKRVLPAIHKQQAPKPLTVDQLTVIKEKNVSNNLPKPVFENLNNRSSNKNESPNVTVSTQEDGIVSGNHIAAEITGKSSQPANTYATNASFTTAGNENKDDRFVFADEEKTKKSKLGGFLRKAKRMFERNAKIKPGDDNNLKVANLEFAIQ